MKTLVRKENNQICYQDHDFIVGVDQVVVAKDGHIICIDLSLNDSNSVILDNIPVVDFSLGDFYWDGENVYQIEV